ncbi:RDD family protein [Microcoleus sp. T3_A4]
MKPKIYAVEEGFKIQIAKAPVGDPKLRYRREVERFASRGEISDIGRYTLDALQRQLGLSSAEATEIEAQVLKPYQDYKKKLEQYEQVFIKVAQRENPLSAYTRSELKRFQEVLGLEDKDITPIEQRIIPHKEEPKPDVSQSSSAQSSATAPPQVQPQHRRENPSQHQSQSGEPEAQARELKPNHVLRYAGFWRRITAFLIDGVISSCGIALLSVIFLDVFNLVGGKGPVFIFNYKSYQFNILAFIPFIGYYTLMELSPLKATVGKWTMGIVVTDLDSSRISLPRAILRCLIWLFSLWLIGWFSQLWNLLGGIGILVFAIPFFTFFTSKKQQCLHDHLTKCVVVRR